MGKLTQAAIENNVYTMGQSCDFDSDTGAALFDQAKDQVRWLEKSSKPLPNQRKIVHCWQHLKRFYWPLFLFFALARNDLHSMKTTMKTIDGHFWNLSFFYSSGLLDSADTVVMVGGLLGYASDSDRNSISRVGNLNSQSCVQYKYNLTIIC